MYNSLIKAILLTTILLTISYIIHLICFPPNVVHEKENVTTDHKFEHESQNNTGRHTFLTEVKGESLVDKYLRMYPETPINSDAVLHYNHFEMIHAPKVNYVKNMKNPCFVAGMKEDKYEMYCMPYFFLLGFPKGGTTDIFQRTVLHQQVIKTKKEPHFWGTKDGIEMSFAQYSKTFKPMVSVALEELTERKTDMVNKITGDYFQGNMYRGFWEKDYLNFDNTSKNNDVIPLFLTPHRIHHIIPNAKFIITIRDPVIRVISDYNHVSELRGYKIGSEHFHSIVTEGINWFKNCTTDFGYSARRCVQGEMFLNLEVPSKLPDMIRRSIYSEYIKQWLEVFPRKQFLFIKFEDYRLNPLQYFEGKVLPFLGLENYDQESNSELSQWQAEKKVINKSGNDVKVLDKTIKLLKEFYKEYNADLASILGSNFYYTYV